MKKLIFCVLFFVVHYANSKVLLFERAEFTVSMIVSCDTITDYKNKLVNECLESILLTDVETNMSYLYTASNKIIVSNNYKVLPNANITMKAGNSILLKPRTTVLRGSKYLARIEPCDLTCAIESLQIQKGISPNNDGKNDQFELSKNCGIKAKALKIFNRYGVMVYSKESYSNEWEGKDYNNNILPDATYYYHIEFENGVIKTGWVYLNK